MWACGALAKPRTSIGTTQILAEKDRPLSRKRLPDTTRDLKSPSIPLRSRDLREPFAVVSTGRESLVRYPGVQSSFMLSRSETIYSTVHYGMSAVSIGVEGINKTLQVVKTGSKVALKSTRHVVGQAHKMLSDMRMPYSEHYKEKEKRQMRFYRQYVNTIACQTYP
eukprot:1381348-Amorphochlora_amoeboformis.AAC.1